MYSLNILYITLSVCILILTGFLCYNLYYMAESLKKFNSILSNVDDFTSNLDWVQNKIFAGVFNFISGFLKKGGDRNGRKR